MPSVCEHVGKQESLYAAEYVHTLEGNLAISYKLNGRTPHNPSIQLLNIHSLNTAARPMNYLSFCS